MKQGLETKSSRKFISPVEDPFGIAREENGKLPHQHRDKERDFTRTIPIIPTPFVPGENCPEVGQYFPSKLATGFGMAKIVLGILEVSLGVVALFVNAELSGFGGGFWAGTVVAVAGSLGVFAGRHPNKTSHILSFLFASMSCVAATGLLVIFTATGLARDATAPPKILVDSQGYKFPFLGEVNSRTPAILVNIVLLILSIISCVLSIFCCLICMREACQCQSSFWDLSDPFNVGDSQTRKDRLVSWLEQQASEESGSLKSQSPKPSNACRVHLGGHTKPHPDTEQFCPAESSADLGRRYMYKVSKKYSNDSQESTSTMKTDLTYTSSEDYLNSEHRDMNYKSHHGPRAPSNKKEKKPFESLRFSHNTNAASEHSKGLHHNFSILPR